MKVELSSRQLSTLLYYAHVGSSVKHKEYAAEFPERDDPYTKVAKIEKELSKQGFFRK